MSRKYPDQSASKNTQINRERLQSRHTQSYADAHSRREVNESMQKKLDEYRVQNPEDYARRVREKGGN